jgi:hypothetical protein
MQGERRNKMTSFAKALEEDFRESKNNRCIWSYTETYMEWNEDSYWSTSCGQKFVMIEGTPKENGYNFCPSCGKPLVELTTM